jgi:hypothetical protein
VQEDWREILGFPGYSVSNTGRVFNDEAEREMTLHTNQRGIVNVSLNRNRTQFKRSVAVLVATAFVLTARPRTFDTPIHLDGDRGNNYANNLLWRPRWHAIEYYRQFQYPIPGIKRPIEERKTREVFETSWDAATKFGLLDSDIVDGIVNSTYVKPTFQVFRMHR